MDTWVDLIVIAVLLMNLMMLSSSRIRTCIRIVAVQGVLIIGIPMIMEVDLRAIGMIISFFFSIALKGVVFPKLLFRALREANIRKEVEPIGGYPFSLLVGVVMFILSLWLSSRLINNNQQILSHLSASVAFATFFTGAFIIVSRRKAITQVIGYLVLENGIYLFGAAFIIKNQFLIELAILLDIFVAVFVMGIAIFHINREFDHIDTESLSQLKDWVEGT